MFYGTLDGMLKAVDARSGAMLWQTRLSSGVVSRPTAFRGPDGQAWLAVLAGAGPLVGMPSASEIDVRDASAAKGFAGLLHDLPPPAGSQRHALCVSAAMSARARHRAPAGASAVRLQA